MNRYEFTGIVQDIEFKKTKTDKEFVQLIVRNEDTRWPVDLVASYWDKLPPYVEPGAAVKILGSISSRVYNERTYNDHRIASIELMREDSATGEPAVEDGDLPW